MSNPQRPIGPLPFTQLFGDTEENFYQLGIKDRERHSLVLNSIKNLIKTPWNMLNSATEKVITGVVDKALPLHPEFKRLLGAYADGLERKTDELAYSYLLPELVSCMNKWIPGMPTTLLGCSTYLTRDQKSGDVIHGRILDFPLQGSFDHLERAVLTSFNKRAKIFSYGTMGMPFPSITCMNEHGLTLALHQKFTNTLSSKGIPIFYLVFELMSHCRDFQDVRDFLKKAHSITTWGLYMSHRSGELIAVDIAGSEKYEKEIHLEENEIVYLGNRAFDPNLNSLLTVPYGLESYNGEREEIAQQKIKALKKKKIDQLELIKTMGTFHPQKNKNKDIWTIDPLTPASIQVCTMNATSGSSLFIPGAAPKFLHDHVLSFDNLWSDPEQNIQKLSKNFSDPKLSKGTHFLMQAQVKHDNGDYHACYHSLQMSIDLLQDHPLKHVAQLYFAVFQFIHEEHTKMLAHLLSDFKKLHHKLPSYLNDHCALFIIRLERILNLDMSLDEDDIETVALKEVLRFELKWKAKVIQAALRKLTHPRIEIYDILYAHIKL